MIQFRTDRVACLVLFLLSMFLFTRGLSIHGLEYRDDEIFYYKATQEMVATGNVLSPTYFGEDRFQKPILYYWLVLCSYKIFGVNWFAARFVAVVFAGLSVCVTWLIAKNLFNRNVATLSAVILVTVPLFFRHAKNAVPDMALNFFIVWAIYCAIRFIKSSFDIFGGDIQDLSLRNKYSILFFVACALGFMIKGFTALIIPILTLIVFSILIKRVKILSLIRFARGLLIVGLIVCPWFFYMIWVHGQAYLEYMLVDETKNRLVAGGGHFIIRLATTFFDHIVFYCNVIGSYFAPWSVFLLGALPLSLKWLASVHPFKEGTRILLIWFLVVFCFFSMIYFSINHYMLVLSTPFAILVSCFCLEPLDRQRAFPTTVSFLRKYMALFIFTVGTLAYAFLFVFLAGAHKWWLFVILGACVMIIRTIFKSRKPITAPLCLGLLLLFVFAQSSLLGKAGITSHAILQKFAATINQEIGKDQSQGITIGVGSHDIHEKEFQVYFEQKIVKAASSEAQETKHRLDQLFATDNEVYCLLTEKDFKRFIKESFKGSIEILQEDYIVRRRMNINMGFFRALLKLDTVTVNQYLKEKLILIKKEHNA